MRFNPGAECTPENFILQIDFLDDFKFGKHDTEEEIKNLDNELNSLEDVTAKLLNL